jgi:hypothetical protein
MSTALWIPVAVVVGALLVLALAPTPARLRTPWGRVRGRRGRGSALRIGCRLSAEELEAERRAEDLMVSVVGADGLEAYRALGFLYAFGDAEDDGQPGYGYLIYPHRPIVSFDARSGRLLNELCVQFPDRASAADERLPDADDALAKWLAINGDELALLAEANLRPVGHQVDPEQARRDLIRLEEWTADTSGDSADGGLATAQ